MQAVATAPTGFYMDVDFAYQMYAGGIYSGGTCGTSLVHARKRMGWSHKGVHRAGMGLVSRGWPTACVTHREMPSAPTNWSPCIHDDSNPPACMFAEMLVGYNVTNPNSRYWIVRNTCECSIMLLVEEGVWVGARRSAMPYDMDGGGG